MTGPGVLRDQRRGGDRTVTCDSCGDPGYLVELTVTVPVKEVRSWCGWCWSLAHPPRGARLPSARARFRRRRWFPFVRR